MRVKKKTILIFCLVFVAAVIFIFKKDFINWPQQSGQSDKDSFPYDSSRTDQDSIVLSRDNIISDVNKRINEISPFKTSSAGKWQVNRFWFVGGSEKDFYVEYSERDVLKRILLEAEIKDDIFNYRLVASFEPGESDWILKSGSDTGFGRSLDLYEFDKNKNNWVKKN